MVRELPLPIVDLESQSKAALVAETLWDSVGIDVYKRQAYRRITLELIIADHGLDSTNYCFSCDKNGACELQAVCREYGVLESPFEAAQKLSLIHIYAFFWRHPRMREALDTWNRRYDADLDRLDRLEAEGRAYVFYANDQGVKNTERDAEKLARNYERGRMQALSEFYRWERFLSGQGA